MSSPITLSNSLLANLQIPRAMIFPLGSRIDTTSDRPKFPLNRTTPLARRLAPFSKIAWHAPSSISIDPLGLGKRANHFFAFGEPCGKKSALSLTFNNLRSRPGFSPLPIKTAHPDFVAIFAASILLLCSPL